MKIKMCPTAFDICHFMNQYIHKRMDGEYYCDGTRAAESEFSIDVDSDINYGYEVFKLLDDDWGGWNSTPSASKMYGVAKSWEEKYGLSLMKISHDTLTFCANRKLEEDEISQLSEELISIHALPCEGNDTISIANSINNNKRITLWWD